MTLSTKVYVEIDQYEGENASVENYVTWKEERLKHKINEKHMGRPTNSLCFQITTCQSKSARAGIINEDSAQKEFKG